MDGDLSDGQARFHAALARADLDAPNGRIALDANRQAIAPNYLQSVTKTPNGLTMRTQATLPDVEQTFNGYFDSSAALARDTIECTHGDPPTPGPAGSSRYAARYRHDTPSARSSSRQRRRGRRT